MTRPAAPNPLTSGAWPALGLVLLNGLVLGIALWSLSLSRATHLGQAEVNAHNLTRILERNLEGEVRLTDLVLMAARSELDRTDGTEAAQRAVLTHHAQRLPQLEALRLSGPDGRLLAASGLEPHARGEVPNTDRDYFQKAMALTEDRLVLSSPLRSRITGRWVLILARPWRGEGDTPRGVVFAVVALETLTRALQIVDVGDHGIVTLRDGSLRLIAHQGSHAMTQVPVGDATVAQAYRTILQRGEASGTFRASLGGETRTWTVRRVGGLELWLAVGLGDSDTLAPYRSERVKATVTVLGSLVMSAVLAALALRSRRREQAAQAELAAEKEQFQVLTEQTDDVIWSITPEGRYTYVSPSVLQQRGFTPEEIMAIPPGETLAMDDGAAYMREVLVAALQEAPSGERRISRVVTVEARRKDGTTFPAEIHLTVIRGADGTPLGIRGTTRDISERMRVQAEIQALIQELTQALTEVKELKGMMPICSYCKKVRDDTGYWSQIETYLSTRTDATFTHGLCPDCLRTQFPEVWEEQQRPGEA